MLYDNLAAPNDADHKRVPDDVAKRPVIIGNEFCGEVVQVEVA